PGLRAAGRALVGARRLSRPAGAPAARRQGDGRRHRARRGCRRRAAAGNAERAGADHERRAVAARRGGVGMSGPALLIDIGNTRLKWAWCDGIAPSAPGTLATPWREHGAAAHADGGLPQAAARWRALRADGPMPTVWITNVAGPVIATAVDNLLA